MGRILGYPLTLCVWPINLGYIKLDEGGCNGRNEICNRYEYPCNNAKTLKECAELCSSDVLCVSFEQSPIGECQLSTTCTATTKDEPVTGWWVYVKSEGQNSLPFLPSLAKMTGRIIAATLVTHTADQKTIVKPRARQGK